VEQRRVLIVSLEHEVFICNAKRLLVKHFELVISPGTQSNFMMAHFGMESKPAIF